MVKFMQWISPKNDGFVDILKQQSAHAVGCAKELKILVETYSETGNEEKKTKIKSFKKNNEISKEIFAQCLSALVKKHDNNLIEISLASRDFALMITKSSFSFSVYGITRTDDYITKLVNIIYDLAVEIDKCFQNLKTCKDGCEKILQFTNEAEELYNEAVSELFHFFKNSLDVMKYKEIYSILGSISNKGAEIAYLIQSSNLMI